MDKKRSYLSMLAMAAMVPDSNDFDLDYKYGEQKTYSKSPLTKKQQKVRKNKKTFKRCNKKKK